MVKIDEIFLDWLIDKSWEFQTLALPNPSVGALIVDKNHIPISYAIHQKSGEAHAELEAIKLALITLGVLSQTQCQNLNPWELCNLVLNSHQGVLKECKIYCTLEPCNHEGKTPSCAKLLADVGIGEVIYAHLDLTHNAKGGGEYLRSRGIGVRGGVCEREAEKLLYPFWCLREKGHFNLFKIAQRLNGDYKNGKISSPLSKAFTHTQRGVADALIISGKTLLSDQPRLDMRCAWRREKEEIPIKILTHQNLCAKDYQCVQSSQISIHHDIASLGLHQGFNLIEGGYTLLESLRGEIDGVVLIFAPCFEGEGEAILQRFDLKVLHTQTLHGGDVILWLQV